MRGRHRGAAHVSVGRGRILVQDFQHQVAVVVVQVAFQHRIVAVHGGGDVRTRCRQAPVGGQAATHRAVAQFQVFIDVDHGQPVRLDIGDGARQRSEHAGDRRFFGRRIDGIGVAGCPDLDQAAAARTFGHRCQAFGKHRVRLVEIQVFSGLRLVGQAPAVVDRTHALFVHLRVQLRIDRIGGRDRGHGLFVQVQAVADAHHRKVGDAVGEQAGHAQVGTEGHAMGAVAIAVGGDGARHVGAVQVVA